MCKSGNGKIYQSIHAEEVPWNLLNFEARLMEENEVWEGFTGDNEYGIILLGGNYEVSSDKGNWKTVHGRKMFSVALPIRCICHGIPNSN